MREGKLMAKDPVCRMDVDEHTAAGSSHYEGTDYYFCSPNCKAAFDKDPEQFVREPDLLGRKIKPK